MFCVTLALLQLLISLFWHVYALVFTGHLFDLNGLNRAGGYTVYDPSAHRKMFRLNVCGEIQNAGCASGTGDCMLYACYCSASWDWIRYIRNSPIQICANVKPLIFASGVCIKQPQTATSAGTASKKLVYRDQVVELTYESGDACAANPSLKHKSIFSFVCKSEGGGTDEPVLVYSDDNTCTHLFSWHTPLVCEQQVMGSCNETRKFTLRTHH